MQRQQRSEERKKANEDKAFAKMWQQMRDDAERQYMQYIESEQQRTGKLQPEIIDDEFDERYREVEQEMEENRQEEWEATKEDRYY